MRKFSSLTAHWILFSALATRLLAQTSAAAPIGEVFASDATLKGSFVLVGSGTQITSGSQVTAGSQPATVKLVRGGEVRVCPSTNLTLSSSQSGRELMLAMGTGAVHLDYEVGPGADTILTPDFRILLAGPGHFRVAVRLDGAGNTCVRTMDGNTASVIVNELVSDGVYQVKAQEQALFRNGQAREPWPVVDADCGCPPPVNLVATLRDEPLHQPDLAPLADVDRSEDRGADVPKAEAAPVQVQVDAPFVFRADEFIPAPVTMATVNLSELSVPKLGVRADTIALNSGKKRGFFRRLGSAFARIFGG